MQDAARSLDDFAGDWAISRQIDDRLGGSGQFEGTARFDRIKGGLYYTENGVLTLNTGASFRAERAYEWRSEGAMIAVFFSDGRPFHRFDPRESGAGDRHHCDPDIYDVVYDFASWPRWQATWSVTGPRKDYVMRSIYTRDGAASG